MKAFLIIGLFLISVSAFARPPTQAVCHAVKTNDNGKEIDIGGAPELTYSGKLVEKKHIIDGTVEGFKVYANWNPSGLTFGIINGDISSWTVIPAAETKPRQIALEKGDQVLSLDCQLQ